MTIDWNNIRVRETKLPARVLATDIRRDVYPVVIRYIKSDGSESIANLTADGLAYRGDDTPFVENIPARVSRWVNVYPTSVGHLYFSREVADANANPTVCRIALLELIFEDEKPIEAVIHPVEANNG